MKLSAKFVSLALGTLSTALLLVCGVPSAHAEFGVASFDQQILADQAGNVLSQAGAHPYAITTDVYFNTHSDPVLTSEPVPDADMRDVLVEAPPGLLGNPASVPECTMEQLAASRANLPFLPSECPVASIVGTIRLSAPGFGQMTFPLFNMAPPSNETAQFAFNVVGTIVRVTGSVRNGGDFGITVASKNIPITIPVYGFELTFWGNPADPSHDIARCNTRLFGYGSFPPQCSGEPGTALGPNSDPETPRAFLTLPVACTAQGAGLKSTVHADSWQNQGSFVEQTLYSHLPPFYPAEPAEWGAQQGIVGCDRVPFEPSVRVEPTNHQADTPTGLNIDFKLPQDGLLNPEGIATADVRKTIVRLPKGIAVSPSAASGLDACSEAQIGLANNDPAACPDASRLGTVEIDSPLLQVPLTGFIYLAKQSENPFGSLMAIYLVAEARGVIIKLAGRIELDPRTGQIVTVVNNSPQLPFDDLKVDFKGGPRSPLVNPHECGTYTTDAQLTPWSGNPPVTVADSFQITSGPGGSACPAPQQFTPGFAIGTVNNQAGAFSPMDLTMTRADGDQQLGGVSMHTPSGLLGTLSSVTLCPEPQASEGTCGADSLIGTVTAASGAGPNPFYVTGGKVYITGPYKGSPFGLSVVVPAKAGPFDLGTIVVRGSISVDPHIASLTVSTDPLPTILQGIPLDLRVIHVSIDRPGFIFNPTNCEPQEINGTLTGGQGLLESVRSPFQVTNCGILGFKPSFSVSASGKTSRANGASLDAKLSYPKGAFGHEANIAKVKVSLPKQLPSRLVTLQKACSAETFEANPASCPAASKIGIAKAHTPILPVELSGPVYFVSHGGQAFPDLVVVLQGYNVTVQLVGNTFISKGITSTTFNTIPDVPVETFELKLPQGKDSALAANGDLCAANLKMPTLFVAQDGTVIKQSTPITATGCGKHQIHHKHKKHRKHKKK